MLKYILISLTFFSITHFFDNSFFAKEKRVVFITPPKYIKYFTFGYDDSIADSFWVRLIQDLGECGKSILTTDEIKERDKNPVVQNPICQKGWSFKMIDVVTDLSPRFELAYRVGGITLSIIGNDKEGATEIVEKGMKAFPTNWNIYYVAGYHYLSEVKDLRKAADALRKAAENGAQPWVYSLAGQLYTKTGQAMITKTMLESFLKQNPDHRYSKRIKERLLEANNALGLTNEKVNFSTFDEQLPPETKNQ